MFAIIPAGGVGERFGSQKLLFNIGDKSIIEHTLERVLPLFEVVVVPTSIPDLKKISSKILLCRGGTSRAESVLNGLRSLSELAKADDIIVIHDGARCCVETDLFSRVIDAAKMSGAATVAIAPTDTLKQKDSLQLIDRNQVWCIQTPQAFQYGKLVEAFRNYKGDLALIPDETSLFNSGVSVVEGSKRNIKVTVKSDIEIVEALLIGSNQVRNIPKHREFC